MLLDNTLEAYDFCLYGLLAPIFAKVFFPPDFQYSLLAAFFLFSIAYIARPFGAVIWGYIADECGRKIALMGTLSLMAIPAIGMAITPSYESIGMVSCVIIIVLRLLQGIAFGGELPTVMVNVYELADKNKKGFFCSLCDLFGNSGYLIGLIFLTAMSFLLDEEQILLFGWRLLFLFSIIFVFLLAYIRLYLIETKPLKTKKISFSFYSNFKQIWLITLFMSIIVCVYYNFFFYNYLLIEKHFPITSLLFQVFVILSYYSAFDGLFF